LEKLLNAGHCPEHWIVPFHHCDELKRNEVAGAYAPAKAHHKATVRRKAAKFQGMHIVQNGKLSDFVDAACSSKQSPRRIAADWQLPRRFTDFSRIASTLHLPQPWTKD